MWLPQPSSIWTLYLRRALLDAYKYLVFAEQGLFFCSFCPHLSTTSLHATCNTRIKFAYKAKHDIEGNQDVSRNYKYHRYSEEPTGVIDPKCLSFFVVNFGRFQCHKTGCRKLQLDVYFLVREGLLAHRKNVLSGWGAVLMLAFFCGLLCNVAPRHRLADVRAKVIMGANEPEKHDTLE